MIKQSNLYVAYVVTKPDQKEPEQINIMADSFINAVRVVTNDTIEIKAIQQVQPVFYLDNDEVENIDE
jgi:hypothetical protein